MGKLRVITRDNGAGLSRDLRLVADILAPRHRVATMGLGGNRLVNRVRQWCARAESVALGQVDLQLSMERIYPSTLGCARVNVLMPNPEWFQPAWTPWLPRFERVLCKSLHAVSIFERLGCNTVYTGFTSDDRMDRDVARERAFFHLAGRSSAKGTEAVLAAWRHHPEWPRLTVVQCARKARRGSPAANIEHRVGYFDDAELRRMQNAHRFHLCPSEAEGYGHYIAEAMSVGAVVLASDAAPMNELITPECGVLLPCTPGGPFGLDVRHRVDVAAIEAGVERALRLGDDDCARLGQVARRRFLERDAAFRQGLVAAFADAPRGDWAPSLR